MLRKKSSFKSQRSAAVSSTDSPLKLMKTTLCCFKSQRSAAVSSTQDLWKQTWRVSGVSNPSGAQPSLRPDPDSSDTLNTDQFQIPAERSRLFDENRLSIPKSEIKVSNPSGGQPSLRRPWDSFKGNEGKSFKSQRRAAVSSTPPMQ